MKKNGLVWVLAAVLGFGYVLYEGKGNFPTKVKEEIYKKPELSVLLLQQGDSLANAGNFEQAIENYKKLIEIHTANNNPLQILSFCDRIGMAYHKAGRITESAKTFGFCRRLAQLGIEANPKDEMFVHSLAISHVRIGQLYLSAESYEKALLQMLEYNDIMKSIYEKDNVEPLGKNNLAVSYFYVGTTYIKLKNWYKASTALQTSSKLYTELHKDFPDKLNYTYELIVCHTSLGYIQIEEKNKTQAIFHLELAKELWTELLRIAPNYPTENSKSSSLADVETLLKKANALK